jgi:hypothetical protein
MGRIEGQRRSGRNVTGRNILRIRMAAEPRVTQEDMVGRLARLGVQINQSQIAKMESGQRPILDYELIAIARALRVPIQAIFYRADPHY